MGLVAQGMGFKEEIVMNEYDLNKYALTVKETKDFILNKYISNYGDITNRTEESLFKEASSLLEEYYINGFYRTNFCDQRGLLIERFEQALAELVKEGFFVISYFVHFIKVYDYVKSKIVFEDYEISESQKQEFESTGKVIHQKTGRVFTKREIGENFGFAAFVKPHYTFTKLKGN